MKCHFKMNENSEIIFNALNHEHDKDDENVLNSSKTWEQIKA